MKIPKNATKSKDAPYLHMVYQYIKICSLMITICESFAKICITKQKGPLFEWYLVSEIGQCFQPVRTIWLATNGNNAHIGSPRIITIFLIFFSSLYITGISRNLKTEFQDNRQTDISMFGCHYIWIWFILRYRTFSSEIAKKDREHRLL